MTNSRWIFMRHAQPETGLLDPPLSFEGRSMLRNVAAKLNPMPSLVVHSRHSRAYESASLLASIRTDFAGVLQVNELLAPEVDVAYAIDQVQEFYTGMDVLFIGHNPTISLLAEAFGADIEQPLHYCEYATTPAGLGRHVRRIVIGAKNKAR